MSGIPRWPAVLAAACLGLALGCQTLKLAGLGGDKPDKPALDDPPARPGKYSFRVSQYVFYSDREVQRDAPLFEELAALREQVYKQLQLPAASSLVHVYLFSDRYRYESYIHAKYPDLPERRAFF